MKHLIYRYLKIFLSIHLLCFAGFTHADKPLAKQPLVEFNAEQANRLLYKLTINLSVQDLKAESLQKAVDTLTAYQNQAQKCVTDKTNALADINKQLQAIGADTQESKALTKDQQYLADKQKQFSQQLAECRLFTIQSQEAITTFSNTIARLTTHELLSARPPIWDNFKASSELLLGSPRLDLAQAINVDHGLYYLNRLSLAILSLLLLSAGFIGHKIRQLTKRATARSSISAVKLTYYCVLRQYAPWLTTVFALALFASFLALLSQDITTFTRISFGGFALLLSLATASFFFYPPKPAQAFNQLPPAVARKLRFRLTTMAAWSFIGYVCYVTFDAQIMPIEIINLSRSVFVIIIAINLISVIWLTTQAIKWFKSHTAARLFFNLILSTSLSITLLAEVFGYFNLSNYILDGTAFSLLYVFITWVLFKSCNNGLQAPSYKGYTWQKKLYSHLGISKRDSFPELWALKIGLAGLLGSALLIMLVKVWGLSNSSFRTTVALLVDGFNIGSMHITPLRILCGLLVFALLSSGVRFIRQRLLKQSMAEDERDNHEALAVILGYVGFGLSFLIAVLVAGINLTGFAVIAGALSVGIGFGLQNIVNNFVSGIILLIERPIKPGDRIIVGQTDGYVKAISVRSTRLTTPDKADVIVPNSELISAQVTNLMFQDHEYRIKTMIGVAYGTDTALVEKLLREIAEAHPGVIKEADSSPVIYFRQFAESSLNFELSCIIDNVNQRSKIISDIHYQIDKTFRQHGIEMPFPQRDINIKSWPESLKPTVQQQQP